MQSIEVANELVSVYIVRILPTVLLCAIALPFHLELYLTTSQPAIQYLFHHILFATANNDKWRRRLSVTPWNRVESGRGEFDDVENRVEAAHGSREMKTVGVRANRMIDNEGTKVMMGQLP